jgi:integrase
MATTFNDSAGGNGAATYPRVSRGLYRHSRSNLYYGFKKLHGKRHECSLRTTDRQIAERRLRSWIHGLEVVDRELERTTVRDLIQKFVAANQGKAAKTRATNTSIIRRLTKSWPGGTDVEVRHIKPSHIDEWLAMQEQRLKNTTYNRYAGVLREMFDIAVRDRIISESPFDQVKTKWKKPQEPVRLTPTEEQFRAVVSSIRSQRYTDHASDSADFIEFLGLAGLGQAEAASLTWGDVEFDNQRLHIRRHKTDTWFYVWMNPELEQLLRKLRKYATSASLNSRVFAIKDAKKALRAACDRLGYPNFSERSIRRRLIQKLWRAGVDKKLIAEEQGHQDGGQLIIETYTQDYGDNDVAHKRRELAKAFA